MNIFSREWTGAHFELFGPAHLIGLGVVAFLATMIIVLGRRTTELGRRSLRFVLAGILVVTETSWHIWNYSTGQWTIQEMLPFHLCSALVWLSIYMFIARKPDTASLLDVLPAWPWYIPIIELLGLAFVLAFYAPFAVKDWRSKNALPA